MPESVKELGIEGCRIVIPGSKVRMAALRSQWRKAATTATVTNYTINVHRTGLNGLVFYRHKHVVVVSSHGPASDWLLDALYTEGIVTEPHRTGMKFLEWDPNGPDLK